MPPSKSSIVKSWVTLGIVVALFLGAYFGYKPSAKMKFNVVCEAFVSPAYLSLNLRQGPTELASITAYDFHGSISEASAINFARGNQKLIPLSTGTVTLLADERTNDPLSYLKVTREGTIGRILLDVDPRVVLSNTGTPGAAPAIALTSQASNDVKLMVSSNQMTIDGNRYVIPEAGPAPLDAFHATLEGKDLVLLQLRSGDRPGTENSPGAAATLTFKADQKDLPLLRSPQTLQNVSLSLRGSFNPDIRIEDKAAEGVLSDRKTDLVIECENVTLGSIAIVSKPDKSGAPALRVIGEGTAKSVRQDGRELVVTLTREVLDKPAGERTRWLIVLGAIAALLLKFVDHALDILLEWIIPKD
jgi:hypothetical protein